MFKKTLGTALLVISYGLLVMSCFAQEEKLTITTYYPSPYGSYRELYVSDKVGIGIETTISSPKLHIYQAPTGSDLVTIDGGYLRFAGGNFGIRNANDFVIQTGAGNTERMRVTSTGNVGIGTVDPWQKIHLKGGHVVFQSALVNDSIDLQFYDANDTSGNYKWDLTYRGNSQGDDLQLIKNAVGPPVMTWQNSTGNVGIGTASPAGALSIDQLGGTGRNLFRLGNLTAAQWSQAGYCDDAYACIFNMDQGNGHHVLRVGTNWGTALSVTNTGNVGIGTATPDKPLEIVSSQYYNGQFRIRNTVLPFDESSIGFIGNGRFWAIGAGASSTGNSTTFGIGYGVGNPNTVAAGNRFTIIGSNGNVGIGTASPTQKLHVVGNIYKTGTVSFVENHPTDTTKEIVYVSLEGGEAGTYVRGEGQLINGEAEIDLPEHFSLVTAKEIGLTAQITPVDECHGLRVVKLSNLSFLVRELNEGKSEARFYYLVNGIRKGYEGYNPIKKKL